MQQQFDSATECQLEVNKSKNFLTNPLKVDIIYVSFRGKPAGVEITDQFDGSNSTPPFKKKIKILLDKWLESEYNILIF